MQSKLCTPYIRVLQNSHSGTYIVNIEKLKFNEAGLIPAIVQDAVNRDVLMMAWMNEESLQLTIQSGETWFWSRSRQELWHKGGTSGNTQKVQTLHYDCDGDTLLILVLPSGPACHTGEQSCFYRDIPLANQ